MPIYKIADLNIEINPKYEKTSKQLAAYITDEKTADFCVEAEQSKIDRLVADGGIDYLSESCIINTLVCREILDNYDGLFFHSSALMFDGKASFLRRAERENPHTLHFGKDILAAGCR